MSGIEIGNNLPPNKKLYFASDFHLGIPDRQSSLQREKRIIRWMDSIANDAHAIFILGDIFDFWFEYKHAIPKGFVRFQGKLAELSDQGIRIYFFTGNHDMWMFNYFTEELDIKVFRKPQSFIINGANFHIGHGDGLGPGDNLYKIQKKVFENKICQFAFEWLHPNLGIGLANFLSLQSKKKAAKKDEPFLGDDEWIYSYCKEIEAEKHHDFYLFGHRHLPLEMQINENSRYINLGEWMNYSTYAKYDGKLCKLLSYE